MPSRKALIFPDDTSKPILDAIASAKQSLKIKMFTFSDPELIKAVIDAKKRGLDVRIMLNPARRDGEKDNEATRKTLTDAGIEVRDSNPAFVLTHEKSMSVDDEMTFVKSLNWETKNLTETRDYAIVTTHPHEVKEAVDGFEADWNRGKFEPGVKHHLIWCVGNGRERISNFIDTARHSLYVQNERYQDTFIIEKLVRAANRGVKVHVMAKGPHSLKKDKIIEGVEGLRIMDDVGIKVHKITHLKLHGKILLADGCRAIVGSINLTPGTFDGRRELAIELDDEEAIERLHNTLKSDWKNSHWMDLSDDGLLKQAESVDS
jgi:cardiolipin synthase A/B